MNDDNPEPKRPNDTSNADAVRLNLSWSLTCQHSCARSCAHVWIAQLIPQWIPSEQVGVTCPTSCLQHENNAFPQVTIHLTPSRPVKNSSDKISKRSNNLVYLCHAKGKSLGKTKTESCSRPPAPTESTFLFLQHKDSHQTEFIRSVSMFKLDSHFSPFLRNYGDTASHNISHN